MVPALAHCAGGRMDIQLANTAAIPQTARLFGPTCKGGSSLAAGPNPIWPDD